MHHRDPSTIQSAVQFISLSSGGFTDQWVATHRTIKNLRQLCHNSLQSSQSFTKLDLNAADDIYVRRRVFTKVWLKLHIISCKRSDILQVNDNGPKLTTCDIQMVDDPDSARTKLPPNWITGSHLQIGRKLPDGSTSRCSPLVISVGDFVDVGLELDVASGDKYTKNRVHLCITHVVQLMKSTEAVKVRPL
jgi:hypothetical protein